MYAVLLSLTVPVLPLLAWQRYQRQGLHGKEQITGREYLIRYAVYTLVITLFTSLCMAFLCEEGVSFWAKTDSSPKFMVKYALIELFAALITAFAEWVYETRKLTLHVEWQEYAQMGLSRFVKKVIFPCGIYLVALMVVILNVSLMFDNVLWGDECFSANTARKSVSGILQVLYFWDNHPPLHYYWLKLFGELFGHTGPVYHLASMVPFLLGVIFALTFLRKRFGSIPASFFILITGLASSCIQYNLEIRMYSLAFMGVAFCYYCAYRILSGGKLAWVMMVFWALVAAYSHYYALVAAGIMMFITYVAAQVRYKKKTWIKGVLSMIAFFVGYAPWMKFLFHATDNVSHNWWMSEIMSLRESLQMVLCGAELESLILLLAVVFLAVMFLTESSFFRIKSTEQGKASPDKETGHKEGKAARIEVHVPSVQNWSDETYAAAVGVLTIVGTLIAAYILCLIIGPVLAQRYLYPLSAVTVLLMVIISSRNLALLEKLGAIMHKSWFKAVGKCALALVLAIITVIGAGNYRVYSAQVKAEKAATEEALYLIGEVPEDTKLVSNQVKHLAWTVLYYYYPDNEILTANCCDEELEGSSFWYFSPDYATPEQLDKMYQKGYNVAGYGEHQIVTYPFVLYYFEKKQ